MVCLDRRREIVLDEPAVVEKFGVRPGSIPDYLALVGDSADGIPGIPRWGAGGTATVLARYEHIENIPAESEEWDVKVRGAKALAQNLNEMRSEALLYKKLATLRTDVPINENLEDLRWRGIPTPDFRDFCVAQGFYAVGRVGASHTVALGTIRPC